MKHKLLPFPLPQMPITCMWSITGLNNYKDLHQDNGHLSKNHLCLAACLGCLADDKFSEHCAAPIESTAAPRAPGLLSADLHGCKPLRELRESFELSVVMCLIGSLAHNAALQAPKEGRAARLWHDHQQVPVNCFQARDRPPKCLQSSSAAGLGYERALLPLPDTLNAAYHPSCMWLPKGLLLLPDLIELFPFTFPV